MKKKIYNNMVLLAFTSVILISCFLTLLFYKELSNQVQSEIKSECIFLEKVLDQSVNQIETIHSLNLSGNEIRITIVSPMGEVLYDNKTDIKNLTNHGDREEIQKVLKDGIGESKRFSETFGKETF